MQSTGGIMAEIRTLLSQGKSSREVIALGYKAGTVYKVQRQLRSQPTSRSEIVRHVTKAPEVVGPSDPDGWPSQSRVLACSPPAYRLVAVVAGKTGLPMWEALDLLIACAIDDDLLEPVLDTWDFSLSSEKNAFFWLPLSHLDYQGNLIEL